MGVEWVAREEDKVAVEWRSNVELRGITRPERTAAEATDTSSAAVARVDLIAPLSCRHPRAVRAQGACSAD
jgi:hypothetical protein